LVLSKEILIFKYNKKIIKMSDKQKTTSNGIGLSTVLFLIFLTLKLAEIGQVATWSWWWVTSPLWIPLVFVVGILVLVVLGMAITALFKKSQFKNK
jgi:hypothetical protein